MPKKAKVRPMTQGKGTTSPTPSQVALNRRYRILLSSASVWEEDAVPGTIDGGDPTAIVLGLKFKAIKAGYVKGVRFYKATNNNGTHTGSLWTIGGSKLATVVFTNETSSGWQEQLFDTPVAIDAETPYIITYHTTSGYYSFDMNYFASTGVSNPPLYAYQSGEEGPQGVYEASAVDTFPTLAFQNSNYWVDLVFGS